ncbi:MAG TPA: hypothetical protein VM366_19830 [Anaerolineae bacterium]|nr:hypothetical protein [Anaerolineae bacterium]
MMKLIRRTLTWVPVLVLLLLARYGQPLTAQASAYGQGGEARHHALSGSEELLPADMPMTATRNAGGAEGALWPSALHPALRERGDALWTLQGTGCDGAETLDYEASCDCVRPCDSCIDLEKEGPGSARPGELITYTFTVTNCGDTLLQDVWVADDRVFGCAKQEVGDLQPGESYSFEGSYVVPLDRCGDLINFAWAVGRSAHCFGVCDKDWWIVDVPCAPGPTAAVEIIKRPQAQAVEYGAGATFAITVTNTGEVDLGPVVVDDPRALECSRSLESLPVGASTSYQCTAPNVTQPFTNVIVATATTPSGETVSDEDEAQVLVATPSIEIYKSPDLLPVERGGIVTFTVGLTNSGEVSLGLVTVRDPLAPECDRSLDVLEEGASIQYECVSPVVTASFTNTIFVTGTTPAGSSVTAQDEARVVIGSLSIEKYLGIGGVPEWQEADTPPGPPVLVGRPVWFWMMVRNTGDAEMSDLTLTDSALDLSAYPECVPPPALPPGAPFDCVVGPLFVQEGQHSDRAQVTGQFAGRTFRAEDEVYYLGYNGSGASIDLEKYIAINGGEWHDADSIDAAPEVPAGPDDDPLIQFLFAVMNTGAVPLYDVSVVDTDLDLSSCPAAPSPLGPGASHQCVVELPRAVPCLQTNVATATGYRNDLPYSDTDAVHYQGVPCYTPTFYHVYLPMIVQ